MLSCVECAALHYAPFEMFADFAEPEFVLASGHRGRLWCQNCGAGLAPLIVPPGKRKELPNTLSLLWQEAERLLRTAELIVLLGYSVPTYDIEARELLSATLGRSHDVLLVDPFPRLETIEFLESLGLASLTVLRQTCAEFFENEMVEGMPSFPATYRSRCLVRSSNSSQMRGVQRIS
jgi:hypothetical protein